MMLLVVGRFGCWAWVDGKIDKQRRGRCGMWRRGMTMQRGLKLGEDEVSLAKVVHISSAGCRNRRRWPLAY